MNWIGIVSLVMLVWINGFVIGHSTGVKRGRELAAKERDEQQPA